MAAPEVAGVAALAWAAAPNATVAQVHSALLQGVNKIPALAGKVSSSGILNAYNTLKLLASIVPNPAPTPTPTPPAPTPSPVAIPAIAALVGSANSIQAGDNISLVAQGITSGGGTITDVSFYRDSNGNGQWDSSDALIGTISSISAGRATISINTASFTAGNYRLFARALDTDGQWSVAVSTQLTVSPKAAYGTNVSSAVAVGINSSAQGELVNSSDVNYFKVQLVAGQQYTFQTVLGSLYDSVLTLLGTNGQTVIAQNDDMAPGNRASSITWQAAASGTYYLAVSSYPGTSLGSFTLTTSGPPASNSTPTPSLATLRLSPIGNQTVVSGGSLTVGLAASNSWESAVQYSARTANSNAASVVVYGNQLTIRAAGNYAGGVQISVTASNGATTAVQSFTLTIIGLQSATRPSGGSVAIPSATLPSAAAAIVLSSETFGAVVGPMPSPSQKVNPAALDSVFHELGR
jgi:hypothetical protein